MVFKRRRRKRTYRRRARGLSKTQKRQVSTLVKSNIETKVIHHTLQPVGGIPDTTQFLNIMDEFINSQGVTSSEFIGKEVRLQSLRLNGMIQQADNSNVVRLILFRARGDYTPAAGNTELFHSPSNPLFSALNRSFVGRVVMDRVLVLNDANVDSDDIKRVVKYVNFKNQRLLLKAVADATQLWYLMYVSDSQFVSHPYINLNMTMRIKDA